MITKTAARLLFGVLTLVFVAGVLLMPAPASASLLGDIEAGIKPVIELFTEDDEDIRGCTDADAVNYHDEAQVDDGSCEYEAAQETSDSKEDVDRYTRCNLEASATTVEIGGTVEFFWNLDGYDIMTFAGESIDEKGSQVLTHNYPKETYHLRATNEFGDVCEKSIQITGTETSDPVVDDTDIRGCTDADAVNYHDEAQVDDGSCEYEAVDEVDDVVAGECKLSVDKLVDESTANVGDALTYTLKVYNYGTGECNDVIVRDQLPTYFSFADAKTTDNILPGLGKKPMYSETDHALYFDADTLQSHTGGVITINGIVATPAVCGDFAIENTGQATAKEYNNFQEWSYSNEVRTQVWMDDCDTPLETPAPTCEFYPTKEVITAGESTELNWTTTNADRVMLSGGTGEVALNGSTTVSLLENMQYTLTVFGENGNEISCKTDIMVTPKPDDPVDPEPEVINGCTDTTATNYNPDATEDDGSCEYPAVVVPGCTDNAATNYNADATENDGSCEYPETEVPGCTDANATNYDVTATVDNNSCTYPSVSTGGGGGSSSPRCELEVSDATITAGQSVTLTWETRRTNDITLTDGNGNVLLTTEDMLSDDADELLDASFEVTPNVDTVYTLTAERGSRDRSCSVEVQVEGQEVVILEVRDQQPLVAGIALAEVPYTGFEAGPMMTTLFYTLLAAWALYLTYVLVIPKRGLQTVTAASPVAQMKEAEAIRPDAFGPLPTAPVAASTATAVAPTNLPVAPVAPQMTVAPVAPTMPAVATANTPVDVAAIEAIAHNHQTLLSSDAIQTFILSVPVADQLNKIVEVVAAAKAQFPLEDGWVVVNNDRMMTLLAA